MNKFMQKLSDMLEQGLEVYACSEKYRDLLKTMSKFHSYSAQNCVLIASQNPSASFVAGFDSWKRNFNRYVKRDSHAIMIKSPCKYKYKNESTGEEEERLGFKASYVFDISDTSQIPNTKPVQIGVDNLSGSVQNFSDLILCITTCASVPIEYQKIKGKVNGFYTEEDHPHIVVDSSLSEIQTLKTLVHEIAHSRLHSSKSTEKSEKKKTKEQRELEAESVAFIVCSHFGLDTSDYSFPYILSWSAEKFREILKDSMSDIQKVSSYIIEETEKSMSLPFPV